jgi:hypothetical protein
MLQTAVAQVTEFFNNDNDWLRVRRRAWALAMVKRAEV